MKVISISKDRKRAQVVVHQKDWFTGKSVPVTRHAHRIGKTDRYTIWVRKGPLARNASDDVETITIPASA